MLLRKELRDYIKGEGGKKKAMKAAKKWFEDGVKSKNEKGVQSYAKRFEPGKIYVFEYKPLNIKTLPWYDARPVVLALDEAEKNDFGINLNLLPIKVKEDLLDIIYTLYAGEIKMASISESAKRQKMLSITWEMAKEYIQKEGYDFALRQYIPNHKKNQAVVSYKNWPKIILCDLAQLEEINYADLRKMFENHIKNKNI
jgi:hypothetical protein